MNEKIPIRDNRVTILNDLGLADFDNFFNVVYRKLGRLGYQRNTKPGESSETFSSNGTTLTITRDYDPNERKGTYTLDAVSNEPLEELFKSIEESRQAYFLSRF